MKIVAHPLHDHPVAVAPASVERDWMRVATAFVEDPTLQAATGRGWDLLCPYAFEAVWNGGPDPSDIEITAPGFVVSQVGHGVLTFQSGYQLELTPGHHLWVRGPINQLKDGIQPLDQVIESDLLPWILTVNWRFTRPGQVVRFEQDEPFATILPYPAEYVERFEGEIADGSDLDLPGVSCICPTYGRVELLEEAIESFLRQDYRGPKELIVLNDYDGQTLECDDPDVRIVNVPYRFRTLGEKLNALVGMTQYDLIAVWFDDDISLPHRLSLSVNRLDPRRDFFKSATALFWNDGQISGPERNVFHGGSLWTRDLFVSVRGYPHATDGVDQAIERAFAASRLESVAPASLAPAENYYLYRWRGTGSYHVSGFADGAAPEGPYAAVARFVEREAQLGRVRQGRITLTPGWRRNYAAEAEQHLERLEQAEPQAEATPTGPALQDGQALPIVFGSLPRPVPPDEALALFRGDSERRISVVLPACNEVEYLQRTLVQFRSSLPPGSEIIVVDNGSTDGTSDFLVDRETLSPAACPKPVTIGEEDGGVVVRLLRYDRPLGVAGARNRGFEHARGEIVVFSDAHNDVPPGWWPPIVKTIGRNGVGIVGAAFGIMGRQDAARSCGQRIAENNLRTEWLGFRQIEPHPVPVLGGGFMAFRHDVLCEAGAFDDGMPQWGSEDLEICLRYWLLGYEVWVVPEVEIPHLFRKHNPYQVEPVHVTHNLIRTALLHLNDERVAHVLHTQMERAHFARAMTMCASSDVWARRDALRARRVHDDDWFFEHVYFRDIDMELRNVRATAAVERRA